MTTNPIQYTSRTFQSILADINSDSELADKPEWFKRLIAGVGDVMSMCIDAQANNSYLETAFTREAVRKLCKLIGYELSEQTTSNGVLKFYLADNVVFPIIIDQKDLCAVYGRNSKIRFESRSDISLDETIETLLGSSHDSYIEISETTSFETFDKVYVSNSPIADGYYYLQVQGSQVYFAKSIEDITLQRFVSVESGSYTVKLYTLTVHCYQQEQKDSVYIGNANSNAQWQDFLLPDKNVLQDTLLVMVGDEEWTKVTDFLNSTPSSKDYMISYNNDGTSKIIFGDGVHGMIPTNLPIYAQYAIGGGAMSNISSLNTINIYAGSSSYIESVTNSTTFTGGSDAESIENAKMLAPATLRTKDRFVTVEDGLNLIYRSKQASIAYIWSNYYGSLSCKVNCVAFGGGNLNTLAKSQLQEYLKERSILNSINVDVVDTEFRLVDLDVFISLNTGYSLVNILPYVQICCQIFFTECGKEIIDVFESSGVESAIELINTIFSTTFLGTDMQLYNMLLYLQKTGYRTFGETIYESNLVTMISSCVDGVNHLTVSDVFPIELQRDEISSAGTFNIQEEE